MPQLIDYPRYVWQMLKGERSAHERAQYERMSQDVRPYIDLSRPREILDVANGRLRPQYAILRGEGHHVTGIDFINRPHLTRINAAYRVARQIYSWRLALPSHVMAPSRLLVGDVGKLPFSDASFDLAVSGAAFEHFLEVPSVAAELRRVLRPGGMLWIAIHVFTSPSGGHNLRFTEYPIRTIPAGVDAWDHLRQRRLPFTVPLNEWRPRQYVEAFARHFEVLSSYCLYREGEHLLTPEIERELSSYTRDELTCATFVIMARK
jgi:SAM-dependent methyltransferase